MDQQLTQQLAELFQETARAHHQAFSETGGDDPEWPAWYADHLHEKLETLLNAGLSKSQLRELLIQLDREYSSEASDLDWSAYYARFFVNRFKDDGSA